MVKTFTLNIFDYWPFFCSVITKMAGVAQALLEASRRYKMELDWGGGYFLKKNQIMLFKLFPISL